ncbi:hypothetical protein [Anabaena sp. AL93]|nr:hypothetical protein [Anabaena sp. AL93]
MCTQITKSCTSLNPVNPDMACATLRYQTNKDKKKRANRLLEG